MTDEMNKRPERSLDAALREVTARGLAALPDNPRSGDSDAYYKGLLKIHNMLTEAGHSEPVNLLADLMQVPKDTVKTRLRTARSRSARNYARAAG